jgi:hypothetical protein
MRNWIMIFIAAIAVAACNKGTNQNTAQLRTLNAVVDAEPLDILVDDSVKSSAIPFQATSSYVEVDSGTRTLKVRSSQNAAILVQQSIALNNGGNDTLLLYGKRGAIATTVLLDDTTDPSSGTFKLRVISLSAEAGSVDVYAASADISATQPTIAAQAAGSAGNYVEVSAGTYALTLTTQGTKDIVFQAQPQAYAAGAKITLVATPTGGGKLVNATLLNGGTATFLPNLLARLKAANAVADSAGFTFKADGTVLLSNVPYAGISSYVNTAAGSRTLQVEASNIPGVTLASQSQNLGAARDFTLAATGTLASPQLVLLADDNSAPAVGAARMRFVNMRDAGAVDVLVNFATQATGVAPRSASGYILLAAGTTTTYTVTFATPGGVAVVGSVDTGALDAGAVYTVYLFGTSTAAQARLVRDR